MSYLVIGGMGYIGCRVVRDLLKAGKEVVCLDLTGVTPEAREVIGEENLDKVKIVPGDVSDTMQLFRVVREHGIDLIIHLAFSMGPTRELQPAHDLRVNCGGMSNVLEAAHLFGLKRVVWTSAAKAFGRVRDLYREPIADDDAIYMPDSIYSATKILNEYMAKHYFEKFGVDSIGLRLPRVFGYSKWTGAPGVFTPILKKAALNIPVTITEPDFATSYVYVEDAANVHVKACEVPTTRTRVFNVKEGEYSNRQLVEIIRQVNPAAQVSLADETSEDYRTATMDTTGLRTELGWQPEYSLKEALREIFNYFRQQEGMPPL